MPFIIGVNPIKKKKTKKKKTPKRKVKTMARKTKKAAPRRNRFKVKEVVKWRVRKPPVANKRVTKRKKDESLDIKKIVRGSVSVAIGMVIAKAAVNKLSEGGTESERWSWPNIATAAASGLIAAFALGALFKLKRPTVGYIAAGGVALAMYKAFTCKLAPKWGWSESWFGADDDIHPDFLGADDIDVMEYEDASGDRYPGDYYGAETNSGGQVVPYNPTMGGAETNSGGQVVAFDPAMGAVNPDPLNDMKSISNRIASAYPGSY